MALRSCDIDRYGQENGDVHGNHRPGSGDQQRTELPFRGKFSAKGKGSKFGKLHNFKQTGKIREYILIVK